MIDASMCEHDPRGIVVEEGQHVCTSCGTMLDQSIDEGAEWRYYGADDRNEDPARLIVRIDDDEPEGGLCEFPEYSAPLRLVVGISFRALVAIDL
jgi:transcription initiation factor TFIIIB Brf1 subunit/transcription initiation factor TFIIB